MENQFSPSTVQLFDNLLSEYQLPASHPSFEAMANTIALARAELRAYYESRNAKEQVDQVEAMDKIEKAKQEAAGDKPDQPKPPKDAEPPKEK